MATAVGIVGLGRVAAVHLAAIDRVDGLTVAGGCDPGGPPAYWSGPAPVTASVAELAARDPDVWVVATPAAVRRAVVAEIRAVAPDVPVFVEKPVAATRDDAEQLLAGLHDRRLVPLYHAAHAPEVVAAAEELPGLVDEHGPVTGYVSYFADAYAAPAAGAYLNSWLDSGSNALSVLQRLGLAGPVTGAAWVGHLHSTAVVRLAPVGVAATVITQWQVAAPSKSTTVAFADGTRLTIDHQATALRAVDPDGAVLALAGWDDTVPRLVRHYEHLFRAEIVDGTPTFTDAEHRDLVTRLFDGLPR